MQADEAMLQPQLTQPAISNPNAQTICNTLPTAEIYIAKIHKNSES